VLGTCAGRRNTCTGSHPRLAVVLRQGAKPERPPIPRGVAPPEPQPIFAGADPTLVQHHVLSASKGRPVPIVFRLRRRGTPVGRESAGSPRCWRNWRMMQKPAERDTAAAIPILHCVRPLPAEAGATTALKRLTGRALGKAAGNARLISPVWSRGALRSGTQIAKAAARCDRSPVVGE